MIELTIKRPEGNIEKVQREGGMTATMFAKMQEATRSAGRGEILSWELVDDRTDAEKAAHTNLDEIARVENEMAKCRDYDNKKYITLRQQLAALKAN